MAGKAGRALACLRPWAGVFAATAFVGLAALLVRGTGVFCADGPGATCDQRNATFSVALLMATLWVVGKPHSAVVALLPVTLLPMLGVGGKEYALENQYFNTVNFVLFGSFLLSNAIEEVGLHRRLALGLLSSVPGHPKVVLLTFMSVSSFLSAFMSNTATASLMCPLAASLFAELQGVGHDPEGRVEEAIGERTPIADSAVTNAGDGSDGGGSDGSSAEVEPEQLRKYFGRLVLGVAYACTIGGMSTLTGTGTNLVFTSSYDALTGRSVSFGGWLALGMPLAALMFAAAWAAVVFMPGGLGLPAGYRIPAQALRTRYEELGSVTRSEITVVAVAVLTVLGWMFRDPGWAPGYAAVFPEPAAFTDATVVLATTLPLFFIPKHPRASGEAPGTPILQWPSIAHRMPIGLFLLIGSGSALSRAFRQSGLSTAIGGAVLEGAQRLPLFAMVLLCSLLGAALSQAASDVAVATILMPIMSGLATTLQIDPMIIMLPVDQACNLAFTLLVSCPANAIAVQTGFVEQAEMLKIGAPLVLVGLMLVPGLCFLFGFQVLGAEF